jgi:hypothetical protein
MPPYAFQDLVAAFLRAMGYHTAWVAPPGPNHGIDVITYQDRLGATNPPIKVQVKRRAGRIPADKLRSFMAGLGEGEVGIYVSTGGYTADAEVEARGQERRRVSLSSRCTSSRCHRTRDDTPRDALTPPRDEQQRATPGDAFVMPSLRMPQAPRLREFLCTPTAKGGGHKEPWSWSLLMQTPQGE